jgi:pantetheine-phosphate adenylyltransferase
MKTKALVAGSFDPIHFGHIDIIQRAARDFDVTVLVANSEKKKYLFTLEERMNLVRQSATGNFSVVALNENKLTADFAFENNIPVIVRGVRNFSDYDYEKMLRDVNISQQNGIETYFLSGDPKLTHISSTAVKELFTHAGFIHDYVPIRVKREMERKARVDIIGVTGNIASGKNWYCERIFNAASYCHTVDVDKLAHNILFQSELPVARAVRQEIRHRFNIQDEGDPSNTALSPPERKLLGDRVFSDAGEREKFNAIMYQPLLTSIRQAMKGKTGLILLNAALLAEFKMTHICNHQVVLVTTDNETRTRRMRERGYTEEQIKHRLQSQYTDERKKYHIEQAIKRDNFGKIFHFVNDESSTATEWSMFTQLKQAFEIRL